MAETRKFDPTDAGNDLQKQVREALGETVRPVAPGGAAKSAEESAEVIPAADPGLGVTDFDAASSFLYYGPEGP